MKRPKAKPYRNTDTAFLDNAPLLEATEQNGDLLIHDLCQNETDSVHDMSVVNTDTKYHSEKPPEKFPKETERAKKRTYLEACL